MYQPAHFAPPSPDAVHALMRRHPLAVLVTQLGGELTADHVPLAFDAGTGSHGTLRGHVARANPLWQHAEGQRVLAVFAGEQAYVSPSAYPAKARHHKVVPTWNYAVAHAHGVLRVVHDAPWLRALVGALTDAHEAPRAERWAVSDAPEPFVQQMLAAIVGIEIAVERIDAKFKLSQNRDAADRDGVVADLSARALDDIAALVRDPAHLALEETPR